MFIRDINNIIHICVCIYQQNMNLVFANGKWDDVCSLYPISKSGLHVYFFADHRFFPFLFFFVHLYARFKLILGYLQLDNQLPLTLMPVLLAPEQASDLNHPVFKMTVTVSNRSLDGIQIYPYIYIRVRSPSPF